MNWDQASRYCQSLGGHLVKIDDDKEQSSITNKIKEMRLAQVSDLKRNDENVSILVARYIHLPNH